jgi:hydroxyacylglutathione hydrolase
MTLQHSFTTKDWFITRQLDAHTWAINDRGEDVCYLACGDNQCLLIDTGWGLGDLKALTASLSPLPLKVVNTHGHPDHTFGNWQFPEVYIAEADIPLIREVPSLAMRRHIVEDIISSPMPDDFNVKTWLEGSSTRLVGIQTGYIFDLGNRILETIAIPGHSPGSIALLDKQNKWLFTGDTFSSGTIWLHLMDSLPLSGLREALVRLLERKGEFDIMYPAHGEIEPLGLPPSLIADMVNGVDQILDGSVEGVPEQTHAGDGLRCDFGTFSMIYNPEHL